MKCTQVHVGGQVVDTYNFFPSIFYYRVYQKTCFKSANWRRANLEKHKKTVSINQNIFDSNIYSTMLIKAGLFIFVGNICLCVRRQTMLCLYFK